MGIVKVGGLGDELPTEAHYLDNVSDEADGCKRFHNVILRSSVRPKA
jgi:hypothetical protein